MVGSIRDVKPARRANGAHAAGKPTSLSRRTIAGGGRRKIGDRYYQVEAVEAVVTGLSGGGRGQLRCACGSGKTVIAQRCAELLCPPGGVVVVVCPSVALVEQTLREWASESDNHVALAVCGDDTVSDSMVRVDELPCTVSTSPAEVAAWLKTDTGAGLRLIVGTHVSAHVVGAALRKAKLTADMLVIDEAHRTAGRVDKHTALVHDDSQLPASRRLYATATPRIVTGPRRTQSVDEDNAVVSMDDESVFGPVLYHYPFSQAIEDGYLDDYRLVVMGVTRRELLQYLVNLPRQAIARSGSTSLHTSMVHTVLARAARQYGMRRVLTFCRRLNEAADFAQTMPHTLRQLPPAMKPSRRLCVSHVHGGMTATQRRAELNKLVDPPGDGWTVITNVRCLSEGIDVPTIDGVVFTYPKGSITDIVQAVGRALRRDPHGTGTATILVPVLLPNKSNQLGEIDIADYELLWQVVRALRAHDDVFATNLDRTRSLGGSNGGYASFAPLAHVVVDLPDGYDNGTFLHHLTARIVASATSPWWDHYGQLQAVGERTGEVNIDHKFVADDGFALGAWADSQRTAYRQHRLAPERIKALEDIGFDFLPLAAQWSAGLRAARQYHAKHGHLEPVRSLRVAGVELLAWLDNQRARASAGELEGSRRTQLDALGMRWGPRLKSFDDYLAALRSHFDRHGNIDIEPDPDTETGRLGEWLVSVRIKRKTHKLSANQVTALTVLGMRWTANEPQQVLPAANAPTSHAASRAAAPDADRTPARTPRTNRAASRPAPRSATTASRPAAPTSTPAPVPAPAATAPAAVAPRSKRKLPPLAEFSDKGSR